MSVPGAVTDPSRIVGRDIVIDSDGVSIDAYLARPTSSDRRPAIIVIHEAFGLNDHIRDIANRFANIGFDAVAPNLYARVGAPESSDWGSIGAKMMAVNDPDTVADVAAVAAYLRALPEASGKVGAIGFCSGGRQTLLVSCSAPVLDAAVDCWGGLIDRATPDADTIPSRPTPVTSLLHQLSCPVFLVGGATDTMPTPELLTETAAELQRLGKQAQVEIFDGVGHAFFADYRPSYDEAQAHVLWPKLVAFFESHLR
jgi:carboxymethylenebutenolidase